MPFLQVSNLDAPLYLLLARVGAMWALADMGYFVLFPILGLDISYNTSPIAIALYFLVWAGISIWFFWDIFARWLAVDSRIWMYVVWSLGFALLLWGFLVGLATLPVLSGPILAPYTDLLFATPWYFLPKATEILVQQLLVTVAILGLSKTYRTTGALITAYAVVFVGAHLLVFFLSGAVTGYALIMTLGALLSAWIFPTFVLHVRSGFVYNYMIHLSYYVMLALVLHTWPPPGYIGL